MDAGICMGESVCCPSETDSMVNWLSFGVLTPVQLFEALWTISLPVSSAQGLFQARILEWISLSSSRGSSPLRNGSYVSCIAGGLFTSWTIGELQSEIKRETEGNSLAIQWLRLGLSLLWTQFDPSSRNKDPTSCAVQPTLNSQK